MAFEEFVNHGVTSATPENLLLGAGTIHKNLVYNSTTQKWNFEDSLIGATSGGNKLTIKPEIKQVDVDGACVRVKGLDIKYGETATLETNLVEVTPDMIKASIIGKVDSANTVPNLTHIVTKSDIEAGDYFENIGFVGWTGQKKPVIVILENAICTSGLSLDGKKKDNAVLKCVFECTADLTDNTVILDKLPVHIYHPTAG